MDKRREGFLLLEVMVAIVVLTGGLLFVMRVYSTAREALGRSSDIFKYSLLLEEKIYDFEEMGIIEEDRETGHFPDSKEDSWQADASSLEPEGRYLGGLCLVKLDAYRAPNSSGKYSLWTYLNKKR